MCVGWKLYEEQLSLSKWNSQTLGTAGILPQEQGISGIAALAKSGHPQRGPQAPGRPE